MSQPTPSYRRGERVLVVATVLEDCYAISNSSVVYLGIADSPSFVVRTPAPLSKVARPDDVARLIAPVAAAEPF